MKTQLLLHITLCILGLFAYSAPAQSQEVPFQATSEHMTIYSGQIEQQYTLRYLNTPYFGNNTYTQGELTTTSGIQYKDIRVRLDLWKHQLIVLTPKTGMQVIIPWQKVASIRLHGQQFAYHQQNQTAGSPRSGYIRQIYHSPRFDLVEVFYYEEKRKEEDRILRSHFTNKTQLYLIDGNRWLPVGSASDLQKLFPDHKKQIKQYMSDNRLNLKTDLDAHWISILRYCETLQD